MYSDWNLNQAVALCVHRCRLIGQFLWSCKKKNPDHRTAIICFLVVPQSRHDECLLTVAHRKQSLCSDDHLPSWKPVIKGHRRLPVLKRNWLLLPSPSFTFVWRELLPAASSPGAFHSLLILNRTMKRMLTGLHWLQEAACQTVKPCDGAAVGTVRCSATSQLWFFQWRGSHVCQLSAGASPTQIRASRLGAWNINVSEWSARDLHPLATISCACFLSWGVEQPAEHAAIGWMLRPCRSFFGFLR